MLDKQGLHAFVLQIPADNYANEARSDLWIRGTTLVIALLAVGGLGFAWRNMERMDRLQMRLMRESEMNAHLQELNVAAAGLAHETRNPLNIVRGLAQIISQNPSVPGEVRQKAGEITEDIKFVVFGGDGSTFDIGLQSLSGALERGHNMVYVCYDNEAYMNTGIQRSGATPFGASTTTSPSGSKSIGQRTWKKNMPMIAAAHGAYVATINPSYPFDLAEKVKKAAAFKGPAYLHAYSSCPTGWRLAPELAVSIGRVAVESADLDGYGRAASFYLDHLD
jgi:pyruvate/2-oxoacid:ferredoxin oxidoreductase beta subunit